MVCSVYEADNASKRGRELKMVIHEKCGREFKRFGALCVNVYMLEMKRENF